MRTDLCYVCPSCTVRTAGACPRCQSTDLLDIRKEADRHRALTLLQDRVQADEATRARHVTRWEAFPLGPEKLAGPLSRRQLLWVSPLFISAVLPILILDLPGPFAFILPMMLGNLLLLLHQLYLRKLRSRATAQVARTFDVLPGVLVQNSLPVTTAAESQQPGQTFCGQVRTSNKLASPINNLPCVAYRVRGKSGTYEIDDADALDLEVVSDTGDVVSIRREHLALDLPLEPDASARPGELNLAVFAMHGMPLEETPLLTAEAVLCEGDTIIVSGPATQAAKAEGYRDVAFARVFTGRAESPVVIRRARLT